jgi:four helix bundle protein
MLRIYETGLEVVRRLVPIVAELERKDPELATQLKKARSSITLNIGEGSHAQGKRRNQNYGYAKGSAQESIAILETAVAAEYIKVAPVDLIEMLRKIVGTLHKCIGKRH